MYSKEMINKKNWCYEANIPFNIAQSKFYQPTIDVIFSIEQRLNGFLLHELRGNILKNVISGVQNYLVDVKKKLNE